MTHGTDHSQDTTTGEAAPTSVANPRRTQLSADGSPTTPENARRVTRD